MTRAKFPLEMEYDRSKLVIDEEELLLFGMNPKKADWMAVQAVGDWMSKRPVDTNFAVFSPKKDDTFDQPVSTMGDHFRFAQRLVGAGYCAATQPTLSASEFNLFLRSFATESAHLNARAFGVEDKDPTTAIFRDSTVLHHWQHYRWSMNGRTIYDLTEPVAQAFLQTEVNVLPSDLRIDGGTTFISVPQSLGLKIWHALTGHHDLAGFYVTLDENALFVCAVGYSHPGRPSNDNALSTFMIDLSSVKTLDDWMRTTRENTWAATFLGENLDQSETWVSLVINTLLYVAYVEDDVRYDPDFGVPAKVMARAKNIPTNKARRKFLDANRAHCRYYVLGEKAQKTLQSAPTTNSAPLAMRYSVRGHWRNQPHGPARTLRKLTWIQPYWKGPEDAPVAPTPTHVVKVV